MKGVKDYNIDEFEIRLFNQMEKQVDYFNVRTPVQDNIEEKIFGQIRRQVYIQIRDQVKEELK